MGGLRVLILGCCVVASGCGVFYLQRIWYDLTASVVGVVGKSDIREVVGEDFIPESSSYFWNTFANDREQLLRVRLSTRKDLVSFADRKSTTISAQWHFCDDQEQAANLGYVSVFVDAKEVPKIPRRSSPVVADRQSRFAYDAILYVRDARPKREGPLPLGVPEREVRYDLERDPRDVCVWVLLGRKLGGFKTNVARIPKEEIAAALGVKVGAQQPRQ